MIIKKLVGIFLYIFFVNCETSSDSETFQQPQKKLNFDTSFTLKSNSTEELCNVQVKYFQDSLELNVPWARKLRDAWGNIPSGIFSGNIYDLGNFDQCVELEHYSDLYGEIVGQHCIMMIPYDKAQSSRTAKISTPSRK